MSNILIIDDDKAIRSKFKKIFKTNGFGVFESPDALSAAESLMKHKSDINLILLDIQIPEIDGRDIYDIVVDYAPQIPILVWSVLPVSEQKLRISKARDYCQKSDDEGQIVAKIKDILN